MYITMPETIFILIGGHAQIVKKKNMGGGTWTWHIFFPDQQNIKLPNRQVRIVNDLLKEKTQAVHHIPWKCFFSPYRHMAIQIAQRFVSEFQKPNKNAFYRRPLSYMYIIFWDFQHWLELKKKFYGYTKETISSIFCGTGKTSSQLEMQPPSLLMWACTAT